MAQLTDYEALSLSLLAHIAQGIDNLGDVTLAVATNDARTVAKQTEGQRDHMKNFAPLIQIVRAMVTDRIPTN